MIAFFVLVQTLPNWIGLHCLGLELCQKWIPQPSLSLVQNFAKALVHADRTSLFLLDTRSNELYARIFDDGYSLDEFVLQEANRELHKERSSSTSRDDEDLEAVADYSGGEGSETEEKIQRRPTWQQQDIRFGRQCCPATSLLNVSFCLEKNCMQTYQKVFVLLVEKDFNTTSELFLNVNNRFCYKVKQLFLFFFFS